MTTASPTLNSADLKLVAGLLDDKFQEFRTKITKEINDVVSGATTEILNFMAEKFEEQMKEIRLCSSNIKIHTAQIDDHEIRIKDLEHQPV